MVLAGSVNKVLVASLGALGQPAVGLSGGDGLHVPRPQKAHRARPRLRRRNRRQRPALARSHLAAGRRAGHFQPWLSASMANTTTSMPTRWPRPAPSPAMPTRLSSSPMCPASRRQRRSAAMALASIRSPRWPRRRHHRRHVAQTQRLPRSSVERRQARTHSARRSCRFPARPVQLPRSPRHRSDGGIQEIMK